VTREVAWYCIRDREDESCGAGQLVHSHERRCHDVVLQVIVEISDGFGVDGPRELPMNTYLQLRSFRHHHM